MKFILVQKAVPKPVLWIVSTPFILVLLPLGLLYALGLLLLDVKDGVGLAGFKKGVWFALVRPGYVMGIWFIVLILEIISLIVLATKKEDRQKTPA